MGVFDIFERSWKLVLWMFTYPIEFSGFSFRVMDCIIFFGIFGIILYAIMSLFDN